MAKDGSLRILAIAYACDPTQGSEPGAGWMWSRLLGRLGHTTVVTRRNNREPIEAELPSTREASELDFVYVDLPAWARFWKKGKRGARLYYLLWQIAALREARRAMRRSGFDVVWHVTFANFWLGSVGGLLDVPFIWGPVGGGVRSCFDIRVVGVKGLLFEISRSLGRALGRWGNPLARSGWRNAGLILVNNPDVRDALPREHRRKCIVFPNVLLEADPDRRSAAPPEPRTALFAGRLVAWKGCSLAIRALAQLPDWRLVVCGRGPDEARSKRLARRLHMDDRVEFLGWVERSDVHRIMRERAHVFMFPSFHDDAPWVVGEAVAHGLPVICLDRGGPPIIAGRGGVEVGSVNEMAADLAKAMASAQRVAPSRAWDIDTRQHDLLTVLERSHPWSSTDEG